MNILIDTTQKQISSILDFLQLAEKPARLKLMEFAVEQYKEQRDKKNELYKINENLESDIQNLRNKMESSKELFQLKDRIEFELQKYNRNNLNTQEKVQQIKKNRFELINKVLQTFQNIITTSTNTSDDLKASNQSKIEGYFLLMPLPFVIIISTLLFIRTSQQEHIVLGSIIFILNLIFFFLLNIYSEIRIFRSDLFSLNYDNPNANHYQLFVQKLSNQENEFLVNAAWIDALRIEKNKIIETIESRMGGRSFLDVDGEIKNKQEEINNNSVEINKYLDNLMNAEEYLKLRRELDLLKIDLREDSTDDEINLQIIGLDNLEQSIKGTIISYIEYLKQKGVSVLN